MTSTLERGMRMIFLVIFFHFLLTYLIIRIGSDIVEVEERNFGLCHHLSVPLTIGIVATLHLAVWPLIARSQGNQNRMSALLVNVLNELLQIPAERINYLKLLALLHLIDIAGILGTRDGTAHLLVGQGTDVVMTELDEHVVARLQTVILSEEANYHTILHYSFLVGNTIAR